MSGVIAESYGRGDALFQRGITNRWSVTWERDAGDGFRPVDLTGYTCRFEMRPPGSDAVVYLRYCDAHGVDGKAAVSIPASAFTDAIWASRHSGEWRMTAEKDGVVELLGSGYWYLA